MKSVLIACALLAAPAMASVAAPARVATPPTPAKKVLVYFNRNTTFAQLAAVKQEVLQDGIGLEYDRLEFDKNGYLTKISFHITCNGFGGSATEDNVPEDYSFGFMRDFTPGAKTTFRIGNFK